MDDQGRRKTILQFSVKENSLEANGYNRVLLQLFGNVGHGKSSFINSCFYTLNDGEYKIIARAGESYGGGTMKRLDYQLTEYITIVDNRGYGRMLDNEIGVIYAQLGNFLPLDEEVKWEKKFLEILFKVEDSDSMPNYSDFIIPIFIYSAKQNMSDPEYSNVKMIFQNCRDMTGVYPIVVLTNKLGRSCSHLESKFKVAGAEQVHAIENYTEDDNLKTRGRCNDLQAVIENALKDAKFRMEQPQDPIKERINRKKILLKFAYEFAVTEKEEEATKKEYERLKKKANKSFLGRFPKE